MSLTGRNVVSIDDLSNEEIETVFRLADEMAECPRRFWGRATAKVLATLFYEPSTRTRLSFESAMQRLAGGVISQWDINASSAAKGETLADTVRVLGKYADAIVLRHPWEGAAHLAARYAGVPVLNAGDGGHEHPTQTLCDLYTLKKRHGTLQGLMVALCGDLQTGRTIHSLAFALVRFGAGVIFVPGNGKDVPDYVLRRLAREHNKPVQQRGIGFLAALFGGQPLAPDGAPEVNAIYMTPTAPNQPALLQEPGTRVEISRPDAQSLALYITRFQKERDTGVGAGRRVGRYPAVTRDLLKMREFRNVSILHPLPRVHELSVEIDQDPRSAYFEQAGYGIPVRMALLHLLLGLDEPGPAPAWKPYERAHRGPTYARREGPRCQNERCVTHPTREPQNAPAVFELIRDPEPLLRCLYCDQEIAPSLYGSTKDKLYYPIASLRRNRASVENVAFFRSAADAVESGYRQGGPRSRPHRPRKPAQRPEAAIKS